MLHYRHHNWSQNWYVAACQRCRVLQTKATFATSKTNTAPRQPCSSNGHGEYYGMLLSQLSYLHFSVQCVRKQQKDSSEYLQHIVPSNSFLIPPQGGEKGRALWKSFTGAHAYQVDQKYSTGLNAVFSTTMRGFILKFPHLCEKYPKI